MFVKDESKIKIGDWATIVEDGVSSFSGSFEKGTRVKVIDIGPRGYDLMDEHGNKIIEAGWTCISK